MSRSSSSIHRGCRVAARRVFFSSTLPPGCVSCLSEMCCCVRLVRWLRGSPAVSLLFSVSRGTSLFLDAATPSAFASPPGLLHTQKIYRCTDALPPRTVLGRVHVARRACRRRRRAFPVCSQRCRDGVSCASLLGVFRPLSPGPAHLLPKRGTQEELRQLIHVLESCTCMCFLTWYTIEIDVCT